MHNSLKIIWIGFHKEGIETFKAICKEGYDISACFTLEEEKLVKKSGYVFYDDICSQFDVPLHKITNINSIEVKNKLKSYIPDLLLVIGWGEILDEDILDVPEIGTIGAHASLLPKYRGSAPVNWALIKGETETGNTLMWLDKGVDSGDIIDQRKFDISLYDSCDTVYDKVANTNKEMVLRTLDKIAKGDKIKTKRNSGNSDLMPRRKPKDGLIDWSKKSKSIYDFIRALTKPYPGAFTFLEGEKIFIWRSTYIPQFDLRNSSTDSGRIVETVHSFDDSNSGKVVSTGDGAIIINEVETDSGKIFSGKDLAKLGWKGKKFQNNE